MSESIVCVVDDDEAVCDSLSILLETSGYQVKSFLSALDFLADRRRGDPGVLVLDVRMPVLDGLELQKRLKDAGDNIPIIMVTGHGDVPMAVRAIQMGAVDFLEKPFSEEALLNAVDKALKLQSASAATPDIDTGLLDRLTKREREVLEKLVDGKPNKIIAYELGISPRTVEIHRSRVMSKLEADSVQHLVKIVMSTGG